MSTQISILPNPFYSTLELEVNVENNASAIVQLFDQQKNIIKMLKWNLKKGTNKTSIEGLGALPAGNYFVEIKNMDANNLFATKLVKLDKPSL